MNQEETIKNLKAMDKFYSDELKKHKNGMKPFDNFLNQAISSKELSDNQKAELMLAKADVANIMKHAKNGNLDALNRISERLQNGRKDNR